MKRKLKLALLTWRFFGTLNHYWGAEKITFWDYVYKKRLGVDTSYSLAKLVCDEQKLF